MNTKPARHTAAILTIGATLITGTVIADDLSGQKPVRAASHAPIGVMAEHMHKKDEWMLSFRYMNMDMDGNRIDDDRVSPDFIVQNVPNRFFGMPGQPPTLRIVPTDMTMDMLMFGAMWAPSDWATLMVMANYIDKQMNHTTYMGGMGTTVLGGFKTEANGLGDTYLGAMFRWLDTPENKVHFNFGITAPTGDTEETDTILTPMGMTPTVRLPYSMQLGSGTWDVKPGITYNGRADTITWGAQYMATFRLGDNNGYNVGDRHEITGWAAYSPQPWVSTSLRLAWEDRDKIDGIDANIVGPVQTADPNNYGGESLFGYIGINLAGQHGALRGHRLALEAGWPIDQDLNGPQMETDFRVTLGWQYAR